MDPCYFCLDVRVKVLDAHISLVSWFICAKQPAAAHNTWKRFEAKVGSGNYIEWHT